MMTLIYRIILAGIVALIGWDLFTEEKLTLQLNAAMIRCNRYFHLFLLSLSESNWIL